MFLGALIAYLFYIVYQNMKTISYMQEQLDLVNKFINIQQEVNEVMTKSLENHEKSINCLYEIATKENE